MNRLERSLVKMADYNYTYLDTTFDLNDKKQNDFFMSLYEKNEDEQIEIIEKELSSVEVVFIEFFDIALIKETNIGSISMNISKRYETPTKAIKHLKEKYNPKIEGTSTTYDHDWTRIITNENNELIFEEYNEKEANIVRTIVDDDNDYAVYAKDITDYFLKYKNKKIINLKDDFINLIKATNKEKLCTILKATKENKIEYYILFSYIENRQFFDKYNIEIEGYLITDNYKEPDLDIYLEDECGIYLPIAFIKNEEGDKEKEWIKYF